MKNKALFKYLVDILYFIHLAGILGLFVILPFGIVNINQADVKVEDWIFVNWFLAISSFIVYLIFLRGLYFLRKMAKNLLKEGQFSDGIILNLKKSGSHFLYSGLFSLLFFLVVFFHNNFKGKIELIYDSNLLIPFFLMIIGIFLMIQSDALSTAKNLQEENELTV